MGFIKTRWTDQLDRNNPLPEYPRPQFERADWQSLNGVYEYAITDSKLEWAEEYDGEITVPYAVESMLSGVEKQLLPNQRLWYRKKFTVPASFEGKRTLINFAGVDWQCKIFVNRSLVGTHSGGYCAFSVDATDALIEGENELTVLVYDPTDAGWQQRGKQVIKPKGFWYTSTSGIWKPVWLEAVDKCHLTKVHMTPDIDEGTLLIKSFISTDDDFKLNVHVFDGETEIISKTISPEEKISIDNAKLWSPEDPFLYDITFELVKDGEICDTVKSYFGMRKFSAGKDKYGVNRFMLNNKPYFQRGLLDQGYWSDGGMTPPCDEALIYDIETAKRLGFNMIRKHIKLELDRWYYHCDRLGMLVWQDMMSGGAYIGDFYAGVLPNLGINVKDNKYKAFKREKKEARDDYKRELNELLNQLYNCTSICVWVPFNEGWGQFDALQIANAVKEFDSTRLVDHASGWHDQKGGDFKSIHRYVVPIIKPRLDDRIFVISEYGGYQHTMSGHTWSEDKMFGLYVKFKTQQKLSEAYKKLHLKQVIPLIDKGLCATVYTQISDVENELNGIMTYDREHIKISEDILIDINKRMKIADYE